MYYICICVYIYTYSPKYCSVFVWGFYEQETMFCTQQTQQLTERDGDSYKKMGVCIQQKQGDVVNWRFCFLKPTSPPHQLMS